jgi:dTDP-4-amino-4,6-dideoxygalactose transaminase
LKVPLADLVGQYRSIQDEVDAAIRETLDGGRFILGPAVEKLEEEVAAVCGARWGVAVNSGTDALLLALLAAGVGPGDEVVTTPFTFVATTEAIVHTGARPVFADIDPDTFHLCSQAACAAVGPQTKALMPVDLFGQMADRWALTAIAEENGLQVVWDSAQAIGATFNGKPIGACAGTSILSFFPTKNLGAFGDGGMVLTNDEAVRDRVRRLRFHGSGGGYFYRELGYCSRLDAIQAAILRVKLKRLPEWTEARRRHAKKYSELLAGTRAALPKASPHCGHTYHQFTIRHERRDELRAHLGGRGIDTGIYYPSPLHLQEACREFGAREGDFPHAERAAKEVLSLPVHPELTDEQLEYVAAAIREFDERQ